MSQQNKIQNPQTQVPQTPQMNDRDYVNDMLTTEKYITWNYSTVMNEASHETLYRDLSMINEEAQECQRELFNLMFEKGWYTFEPVSKQTLDQSFQNFMNYNTQLPTNSTSVQ